MLSNYLILISLTELDLDLTLDIVDPLSELEGEERTRELRLLATLAML